MCVCVCVCVCVFACVCVCVCVWGGGGCVRVHVGQVCIKHCTFMLPFNGQWATSFRADVSVYSPALNLSFLSVPSSVSTSLLSRRWPYLRPHATLIQHRDSATRGPHEETSDSWKATHRRRHRNATESFGEFLKDDCSHSI